MPVGAVHQFVPSLAPRDAIGAHALQVQSLLREMGLRSELFVDQVHPGVGARTHPYRRLDRHSTRGEDWILYQSSIGSPMADFIMHRGERKLVNYHNVTPAALLELWDPLVGEAAANGRRQMERLAPETDLALAVSSFSRAELMAAGYETTAVAPLLIDLEAFDHEVDEVTLERLSRERDGGGADLLFVGRVTPHKAQHDLVKAVAVYRRVYDPRARLHLVGGVASEPYHRALVDYARALGIVDSLDLAGSVTPGKLAAYYRSADVFVCLSDHEGFCVPLLEAMHHDLPVVAFAAAAVPETVAGAGLLLGTKRPSEVAVAVDRVLNDARLRDAMTAAARQRLADYQLERTRARFRSVLEEAFGLR